MSRDLRIFITGASGVGKTTLMDWISEEYKIPKVSNSTKPLWELFGIKDHKQLIQRSLSEPLWSKSYQWSVLNKRRMSLENLRNFVTDRSPIDNWVYFMLQAGQLLDKESVDEFTQACKDALLKIPTHLIYIKYPEEWEIEDDGCRVLNDNYQRMVDMLHNGAISYLVNKRELTTITIDTHDFEVRKDIIKIFIK